MTEQRRGFSRGVHDYYAHYANNADAKIGALFGLNFAIAGILIANLPDDCLPAVFAWQAVALDAVAGAVLLYGIYPRTPSPGGKEASPIFWEDVVGESSAEDYATRVEGLTDDQVERAYALNNYVVARVLHTKFWAIRIAIWFTVAAVASTLASVIAR
jgi:Family of unknown function (DUF5706)